MNPIVQAYVENYDLPDLQEMLRDKMAILEGRKELTSSSTNGASYSSEKVMELKDHIGCLQEAINLKKFELGDLSGMARQNDGVREVQFGGITRF